MNTAIRALIWEQVWRNRIVFPALALLLALGGGFAYAQAHAAADLWWVKSAHQTVIFTFLASLLIGFAPFTLMESHSGWRMNSMVTRWFVLPVRTSVLVLVPFLFACAFMALLMGAWTPVLNQLGPGFDATYFLVVLVLGAPDRLRWRPSTAPCSPSPRIRKAS
jgi:uncharacterized membrane protein